MQTSRLQQQMDFLVTIDKLKTVFRRNYVNAGERLENTAEHSWHAAMYAMLLAEYANQTVDPCRVVQMLLIHDIVEIIAGDTYIYSAVDPAEQQQKEYAAAEQLFGLLPPDQGSALLALWHEFEDNQSADAQFAKSIDRFVPLLQNYHAEGKSWQENGIIRAQVEQNNLKVRVGSEDLWRYAQTVVEDAVRQGYLPAGKASPS